MKKRVLLTTLLVLVLVASCAVASAAYYHISGTSWLKVRQLPYTNATVLGNYRQDYALTVSKKYGDWSYVVFTDGHEGYVMNKYIKSTSSYKAWVTTDNTALRKGPDTSFSSDFALNKGTKVTVLSHGTSWDYISTTYGNGYIRNSYLSKKYVAPNKNTGDYTAYVTSKDASSVNIRKGAGKGYAIIGKAYVGESVYVISHGKTWDKIEYNGVTGYMMNQYLSKKKPGPTPPPAPTFEPAPTATPFVSYTAYVTSPNGKSVNVRNGVGTGYATVCQLPIGTGVTVLKHTSSTWYYIEANGQKGYIMSKYLTRTVVTPTPKPTAAPTATPTPAPFVPYAAYITSENGKSVNLRNGPGTGYGTVKALGIGTAVDVISTAVNGTWSRIQIGKTTGYVMTQYLSTKVVTPTPVPTATAKPSDIPYAAYVISTNGEDVNMRKGPGTGYSNVKRLPVGTKVTVLKEEGTWFKIKHKKDTGYMMKKFLTTKKP